MTSKYKSKILSELVTEIYKHGGIYAAAKLSKIPASTIESWIYSGVVPSIDKVEKILDCFGLELLIFEKE